MQHLPDGKPQTRKQTKVIRKKVFMVALLFDNPFSIELAIYRGKFVYEGLGNLQFVYRYLWS